MTDAEAQDFLTRFAAAWAARDGEAFLALWHPEGVLRTPLADRPIAGHELGRLNDLLKGTGTRYRLAAPGLEPARRGGDHRVAEHASRRRTAFRLARGRQVPPRGRQDHGGAGSIWIPHRCGPPAAAISTNRYCDCETLLLPLSACGERSIRGVSRGSG